MLKLKPRRSADIACSKLAFAARRSRAWIALLLCVLACREAQAPAPEVTSSSTTCAPPPQDILPQPTYDPGVFGSPPPAPTFPINPDEQAFGGDQSVSEPPEGTDPVENTATTPAGFTVGLDGSARYTVPIDLPPGRQGLVPQISLAYSSNGGSMFVGEGFKFTGFLAIRRCARTIRNDGGRLGPELGEDDRFCFAGKRLVSTGAAYGRDGTEYRLQPDTISKIVSVGGVPSGPGYTGPDRFTMWRKNGQRLEFGGSSHATISQNGVNKRWLLRAVYDRHGNRIEYIYDPQGLQGDTPVYYPAEVRYGAHDSGLPHDKVVYFDYGVRPDPIFRYAHGARFSLDRRLERIRVTGGRGTRLIRTYHLSYELSPVTHKTRLASLRECTPQACKKPITFTYEAGQEGFAAPQTFGSSPIPTSPASVVMDVDGDGRDELVYPGAQYWRIVFFNDDEGRLVEQEVISTVPTGGYSSYVFQRGFPMDYNLDGRTDLLLADASPTLRVLLSTGTDFHIVDTGVPYQARGRPTLYPLSVEEEHLCGYRWVSSDPSTIGLYVLDLNGDGVKDLLHRSLSYTPPRGL